MAIMNYISMLSQQDSLLQLTSFPYTFHKSAYDPPTDILPTSINDRHMNKLPPLNTQDSEPLDWILTQKIQKTKNVMMNIFRPIFRNHGITEQQWRILWTLKCQGPLSVGAISNYTHLLAPSLTGILNRMERLDLISRQHSTSDRRCFIISISKNGQRLMETITPLLRSSSILMSSHYKLDQAIQLLGLLEELDRATLFYIGNCSPQQD